MPKASVIIPVYNAEKYLRQCLNSVLNQTLNDIEIICVDDGSSDTSISILEEYARNDSRVNVLKKNHSGAGAARNLALSKALGKYVYFMDADDYCDISLLEKTVYQAELVGADIVVFGFYRVDEVTGKRTAFSGMNVSYVDNTFEFSYKNNPEKICSLINPTPWNKLLRKDFLLDNGLKYLTLTTTNDITFATLCALKASKITYISEQLYYYRIGLSKSITSKKRKHLHDFVVATLAVDEGAKNLIYYDLLKKSIGVFISKNLFVGLERYAGDEDTAYCIEYLREVDAVLFGYHLFRGITLDDIGDKKLYMRIKECQKRALQRNDFRYLPKIIVSMTSFPFRIATVHKAIASIFMQSKQPDKVVLYLSENQFPNKEKDLPEVLLDFKHLGLEIKWCEGDLKSHKKYFYAMQEYPEDIIITVDDDLIYYSDMIEKLMKSYIFFPNAVSSVRTHLINYEQDGTVAAYSKWKKECDDVIGKPSMQLFPTSGAGTLFPPHCMDRHVFNEYAIKKHILNADDIWLKIMQLLANTPVVLVDKNRKLQYIEGTQAVALEYDNVFNNQNDVQLNNILNWLDSTLGKGKKWFDITVKQTSNEETAFMVESRICQPKKLNMYAYLKGKFIGGIACYREHGLRYTLKRIVHKIYNKF